MWRRAWSSQWCPELAPQLTTKALLALLTLQPWQSYLGRKQDHSCPSAIPALLRSPQSMGCWGGLGAPEHGRLCSRCRWWHGDPEGHSRVAKGSWLWCQGPFPEEAGAFCQFLACKCCGSFMASLVNSVVLNFGWSGKEPSLEWAGRWLWGCSLEVLWEHKIQSGKWITDLPAKKGPVPVWDRELGAWGKRRGLLMGSWRQAVAPGAGLGPPRARCSNK